MNYTSNPSVPFDIPNINHGLQVAKGLLKVQKEGLCFEFEVQDSFLGMIKSGIKTETISYQNLEEVRFEKGWWNGKVILEGTSMRAFDNFPGSEQGRITLKIKRSNRDDAQNVISSARVHLSEQKLKEMNDDSTEN